MVHWGQDHQRIRKWVISLSINATTTTNIRCDTARQIKRMQTYGVSAKCRSCFAVSELKFTKSRENIENLCSLPQRFWLCHVSCRRCSRFNCEVVKFGSFGSQFLRGVDHKFWTCICKAGSLGNMWQFFFLIFVQLLLITVGNKQRNECGNIRSLTIIGLPDN